MAAPPSTSSGPTSTTAESPVLSVIDKRLRALRKKKNRIIQMEESVSQGKTLNKEQLDVLQSKPSVIAIIDELEKLRSPLATALVEELSSSSSSLSSSSLQKVEEKSEKVVEVVDDGKIVKDLLKLMYFGSLFDVKEQSEFASLMFTRSHERSSCLTYDYVTDDATDVLGERDLDLISALQGLMISRPVNTAVSHKDALERCIDHAKLWLSNSEQLIDSQSNVTYAGLREKLEKIMASDFFTTIPEMKRPGEVAAAGVGSFGSFQVSMNETAVPVEVPVQIERSVEQHNPEMEEHVANHEEYEIGEHQTGSTEEHQDDVEAENPSDVVQTEQDQEHFQAEEEHGYRNSDFKEQQYVPRRGSRGGRGGGGGRRGGYFNGRGGRGGGGRGGGPYQNGRSHQYYDNYHQPRNYYNKRGGRGGSGGGGGGGNSYYNHPSSAQGNHAQANMGVAS